MGLINSLVEMGGGLTSKSDPLNPAPVSLTPFLPSGTPTALKFNGKVLNPEGFKMSRSATWSPPKNEKEKPAYQNSDDTLDFSFILDASETVEDLQPDLRSLYNLAYPLEFSTTKESHPRPPVVKFQWKDFSFVGVVSKVDIDVTLFDHDGTQKRAKVTISMKGWAYYKAENADSANKVVNGKRPPGPVT